MSFVIYMEKKKKANDIQDSQGLRTSSLPFSGLENGAMKDTGRNTCNREGLWDSNPILYSFNLLSLSGKCHG